MANYATVLCGEPSTYLNFRMLDLAVAGSAHVLSVFSLEKASHRQHARVTGSMQKYSRYCVGVGLLTALDELIGCVTD